jgi:hypothetical protein
MFTSGNLAGQYIAERGEGVMKSFIIDGLVQVLDKNITLTGLAEGGVTLRPHDTAYDKQ